MKMRHKLLTAIAVLALGMTVAACGKEANTEDAEVSASETAEQTGDQSQLVDSTEGLSADDAVAAQSAGNAHIDFASLQASNDEIIAWLQVPGTSIDCPVLKSSESDDYYRNHNSNKESDEAGAAYIEMAQESGFIDFNTVIHGHGGEGIFGELTNFANPDFFEKHQDMYIYLPDNQLTYAIWAVFERDNTSLIRDYSFAEAKGDREFLDYVYNGRIVGKQVREGWEDLTEYNFLVTLTIDEPGDDKQLVVIGAMTNDAAGTIDRDIVEEINIGPLLTD